MSTELGHLLRDLAPQVLGALTRRHRDFAAVEDAVQEALIAAAQQWPDAGVPANPRGWLYHVAMRRLTDHIRSETSRRAREESVAAAVVADWAFVPSPDAQLDIESDDSLALVFMCCHPSLTPASAVALTLRAVGGLTTAEIASAFLVPEATMAQRISRAKQTIKTSGVPFVVPTERDLAERRASVLQVLYLIYNEGYAVSAGAVVNRVDLSSEAIRLTRMLLALMPDDAEVAGLLALMLLTEARREARTGASGELIPLDEQDRSRWDRSLIDEGTALISSTLPRGEVGAYQLQAAIAALHDEASSTDDTDWPQILALYRTLEALTQNPIVSLNRAIAEAMVHGPAAGLASLDVLERDERLRATHRLIAVRAHLLERLGDLAGAAEAFRNAAQRTASIPERDYLLMKAARLGSGAPS